tara:strand:- start:101 stop:412 length:312 start_codon:yes stop_codon:yes gene_type:complete
MENERIKKFDDWFITAKPGDKYIYHTGSLAVEIGRADGFELKELSKHVFNKCCKWDLSMKAIKKLDNRIKFKPDLRLFQKSEKYKQGNETFTNSKYIAVKIAS